MPFASDLKTLLGYAGFGRLLRMRLVSQTSDGIFQAGLASAVLFSPDKSPEALAIAGASAAVFLPYSILGPFVGVFLDRWSRRKVLFYGSLLRALFMLGVALAAALGHTTWLFIGFAFLVLSVNRFILAGMSASLPHVVPGERLVMANSIKPTCGTIAYTVGLGLGTAIRHRSSDVVVLASAAALCFTAAYVASRLPFLGPDRTITRSRATQAIRTVAAQLVDAGRNIPSRAGVALSLIAVSRIPFGVLTTAMALMSRQGAHHGDSTRGLGTFILAGGAVGLGLTLAMVTTSHLQSRHGYSGLIIGLLSVAAVAHGFPTPMFTPWAVAIGAFGIGWASQGLKICTDTVIQRLVPDRYLGRVFAIYDLIFNASLVLGALIAAFVLPPSGQSVGVLLALSAWFVLAAIYIRIWWWRSRPTENAEFTD